VLARDGYRCQYCGLDLTKRAAEQTVDHIVPVSVGGSNWGENLRAACLNCNRRKQDRSTKWLRMYLAFVTTPYARVITLEQYHQLRHIGVALVDLELRPFHFELPGGAA
jgi:hypothetical protein